MEIKEISLVGEVEYINSKTIFKFRCSVSKGTYIRSLIKDIAYKLDTVGIMTDLRRLRQGKFKIENSISVEEASENKLINIIDILDYTKVELTSNIEKQILNGGIIDNIYNEEEVLFTKEKQAIALYKIYNKDNTKLKPYKMFKGGI